MIANRIIAIATLALSIGLYALGHFVDNQEAYLFPRLIAIGMGLISIGLLIGTWTVKTGAVKPVPWAVLVPALVIFGLYLGLAEDLGFYLTAFVAFLAIVTFYAPDRVSIRGWINRLAVSLLFMGAMYSIFALLLKVQTPRGLFV